MSIENNMRRSSPKLLGEVLKSKNVVCTPNYNVINSYLPFSFFFFFHFSMTTLLQLGVYPFTVFYQLLNQQRWLHTGRVPGLHII